MTRKGTSPPKGPGAPALLVVAGDFHVGSTLGLIHPDGVPLDDGGHYLPSAGQRWLWARFIEFVKAARQAARGRRVYVVLNGDLVDGKPHGSVQVVADSMDTQREMAKEALGPLVSCADRLFVVRGTEAHVGPVAQHEETLAREWSAERSQPGVYSWWHLRADFAGVLLDVAHHVQGGGQPWTTGGAAVRLAAKAIYQAHERQERAPRLVLRSHVHKYQDSGTNVPRCRAVIMPAWQLMTAYGHRIAARPADVGGLIARIKDGEIEDAQIHLYTPPAGPTWREH